MPTQASLDYVQSLYVAYYGRPADQEGLQYWAQRADQDGQGAILNAFGTSAEFAEEYGDLDAPALVDSLYQQLFGREAEVEGRTYYAELLASGEKSLAEIAVTIMNAAQGSDRAAIDAKLDVAQYYTDNTAENDYNVTLAESVVAAPDGDTTQAEVASLKSQVDTNTLVINDEGTLDLSSLSFEGIEAVRFTQNVTVDASQFATVESLAFETGATLANLDSSQSATALLGNANEGQAMSLVLEEADDEVNVVAEVAHGADPVDANAELNLMVEPPSEAPEGPVRFQQGTLNLSGDGAVNYEDSGRGFKTIDASALEGGLTFTGNTYAWETVSLGSGADTLNMAGRSNYHTTDRIIGFDAEEDTLDVISGEHGDVLVTDFDADSRDDVTLSEVDALSAENGGAYVAFESEGSTFVYADTEGREPGFVSDGDFLIELVGTTGLAQTLAEDTLA